MTSQQILFQSDAAVLHYLTKIHERLNLKFPFIQQSRELTSEENELLLQLGTETINYKILVSAMAIDTYTEHIAQIFNEADTLLQTLSVCLSCAQKMKTQLSNPTSRQQQNLAFENLYNSVINMTESASLFNPNSPYLELYRSVISNQYDNLAENIYSSLKEENTELKERLKLNDQKIIQLEIKLTRILQQHEGCDLTNVGENIGKSYELKDQLEKKNQEIQKMNEEFCLQIEKYNVVYEALKRELDQYKAVDENVNTVDLIEKLETEIVVLREETERQQMINEELRRRLQIISESNFNPISSIKPNIRKRQYSFNHTSFPNRDDQYPPLADSYYETETEQFYGDQDMEDAHVRLPYSNRFSGQQRGYSEWSPNMTGGIKTSYRY